MTGPDAFDDTADDHEQFETQPVARDVDVAASRRWTSTERLPGTPSTNRSTWDVTPIPEDRRFVHEPSDDVFDSTTRPAVFRRGWTAGRHAAGEADTLDGQRETRDPDVGVSRRFRPWCEHYRGSTAVGRRWTDAAAKRNR